MPKAPRFGVPNLRAKPLARATHPGKLGYFWEPPRKHRGKVAPAALGTDLADAQRRALNLNARLRALVEADTGDGLRLVPGSIRHAVADFWADDDWPPAGERTRKDYKVCFEWLVSMPLDDGRELGDLPVIDVEFKLARAVGRQAKVELGERWGRYLLVATRRLWNTSARLHGATNGNNPFARQKAGTRNRRSVCWAWDQVRLFVDTADRLGEHDVGTACLAGWDWTHRPADILTTTWRDLRFGIREAGKNGLKAALVPSSELIGRLKAAWDARQPDLDDHIVLDAGGKPWASTAFRHAFARVRDAAALPTELKFADLRRSGASEAGEAGATRSQQRAAGGWANDAVLSSTYDRSLIEAAAGAMEQREAFRSLPPRRKSVSPFFEAITGDHPSEATPAIGSQTEAPTPPPVPSASTGSELHSIDRDQLQVLVWSEPVSRVAARHGVSEAAVRKRCRRLSIPVPGNGFWAQVRAGKRPHPAGVPQPSSENA
jgi:hypothetical protein